MSVSRVLSMRHTVVPAADRTGFRQRAKQLRDHYTGRGCRYWVFEESARAGAFVEFFEAGSAEMLQAAHGALSGSPNTDACTYVEVELN